MNNEYPLVILDSEEGSTFVFYSKSLQKCIHPTEWLSEQCLKHGSSLEGRKTSFKTLTNTSQKPAILISEISELIYFPLKGDNNFNNIYVNYSELVDYNKKSNNITTIHFREGSQYDVPFDYRTVKKQIEHCVAFIKKLHE